MPAEADEASQVPWHQEAERLDDQQWMSAMVLQILRTVEIEMDKEGSEFEDWQQCLQAHRCFHRRAINDDIDPIAPGREPDELLPGANGPDVSVPIRYEPIILAMDEIAIKKQLDTTTTEVPPAS